MLAFMETVVVVVVSASLVKEPMEQLVLSEVEGVGVAMGALTTHLLIPEEQAVLTEAVEEVAAL